MAVMLWFNVICFFLLPALAQQWPTMWEAEAASAESSSGAASSVHGLNISDTLGRLLSPQARIYMPGSQGYVNATTRWSALDMPDIVAVVRVATEADMQRTVVFANAHDVPFLVRGGGHGTNTYLANARGAIYIWTRGMAGIRLSGDGDVAVIEAGAQSGEVIKTMWDLGKDVSATGCDCVGFMGPVLGGGHGWLQGRLGLVTDNVVSARVVLASGEIVTVSDKADEHPDLFWALRGAGHNFGVVTSVHFRVFDRNPHDSQWAFDQYIFSADTVEALYDIVNDIMLPGDDSGESPIELTHYAHFEHRPEFDAEKPIILFWVIWQGGSAVPAQFASPLRALGPLNLTSGVVDTTGLNLLAGAAYDTPNCGDGANTMLIPIAAERYNTTALRAAMDLFAAYPPWLNNSIVLLEGYSTAAVRGVRAASTAYPDRFNTLLIAPLMVFLPGGTGGGSEAEAFELGEGIRNVLVEGTGRPLHAYVNYARGDETAEAVYGYEPWRLQRLRALKKKYDPHGRFNF